MAVDLLGRPASVAVEWLDAESALETHGLAWLAEPWMLDGESDRPLPERLREPRDGDPDPRVF